MEQLTPMYVCNYALKFKYGNNKMINIRPIYLLLLFFTFSFMGCNVNDSSTNETETESERNPIALAFEEKPEAESSLMPACEVPGYVLNATSAFCFDNPTINYPSNNSFQENTVTFSWNDVDGPSYKEYTLLIDDNSNFSSPEFSYTISGTSKTVYSIPRNIKYYWKVIVDAQDPNFPNWGYTYYMEGSSSVNTIKIRPESPGILNGSIVNGKPQLNWSYYRNLKTKLIRESYIMGIQNAEYLFNEITNPFDPVIQQSETVLEDQLSQNFIIPQNAQLFNTVSYYAITINGQGWVSLRTNNVFFEIEGGGGGIGGL